MTSAPDAPCFSAERLVLPGLADTELSFALVPGLTLVRGGEGRGKSSLLRVLAGEQAAAGGRVERQAGTVFLARPTDAAHDQAVASAWLAALRPRFAGWRAGVEAALVEDFALTEHMAKPLYMLSAGSRRKLGLVAAAASGAMLTLLDQPYAALDACSGRVLTEMLAEAAAGTDRAWVLADYELPAGLAGVKLAARIDLGD